MAHRRHLASRVHAEGCLCAMAGATNVETEWVQVPDDAVIDEPNRANVTLVWPLLRPDGCERSLLHAGNDDVKRSVCVAILRSLIGARRRSRLSGSIM
jgi:hypothetical protein